MQEDGDLGEVSGAAGEVRHWLNSECRDPLVLWPAETIVFSGSQSSFPQNDLFCPVQKCKVIRPVCCYRFDGFKFSAHGGWIFRDGAKLSNTNIMPSYSDLTMEDDDTRKNFKQAKGDDISRAFILTHNPVEPYGHFLLEMVPKLLVYAKLSKAIEKLPILLSWYTPRYVVDWIQLLMGDVPIIRLSRTEHQTVHHAFYSDLLMDAYVAGSAFREFRDASLVAAQAVSQGQPSGKIFITRKARRLSAGDFRVWENESDAEHLLLKYGFSVMRPEELPITEQIIRFRAARVVVGELSSALHNTIFSQSGTLIIQINPFNAVQSNLSLSLGHRLISILPDSGRVSGWPPDQEGQAFTVETSKIWNALESFL